jgi:hypothetical protein
MKKAMIEFSKDRSNKKRDECYTPATAVNIIRKYLPKLKWWEPCDTSGRITSAMINNGYDIIGTTTDFFTTDIPNGVQAIITNPPYSEKDKWLERCYELGLPFALLLPITALEGVKRAVLYRKYGISVIILDKRMNFTGGSGAWFNTSWFTWKITEGLIFEKV